MLFLGTRTLCINQHCQRLAARPSRQKVVTETETEHKTNTVRFCTTRKCCRAIKVFLVYIVGANKSAVSLLICAHRTVINGVLENEKKKKTRSKIRKLSLVPSIGF